MVGGATTMLVDTATPRLLRKRNGVPRLPVAAHGRATSVWC
jgi:hypothetical protein